MIMMMAMACDDDIYYMTLARSFVLLLLLSHFYLHTESDRHGAIYYSKLLHLQKPHKRTNTHVTTKVTSSIMAVVCVRVPASALLQIYFNLISIRIS